jgi:hypothetical protein
MVPADRPLFHILQKRRELGLAVLQHFLMGDRTGNLGRKNETGRCFFAPARHDVRRWNAVVG